MTSPPSDPADLAAPLRLAARVGARLRLLVLAAVAGIAILLWWNGTLGRMIEPDRIRAMADAAGPAAPLAFIVLLIPLNPVLLAGAPIWVSSTVFPLHLAIIYSIIGATVASAGTHALASYFGREWARERIPHKLHGFRDRLESHPLKTVATLRILLWINPGVDLLMAVSRVRPLDYLIGTLVGIALPTAVRVYIGYIGIEAVGDSNAWIWAVIPITIAAIVGFRLYRKSRTRNRDTENGEQHQSR